MKLLILATSLLAAGSIAHAEDAGPMTLSCEISYSRLNQKKDDLIFDNIAPVKSVLEHDAEYARRAIDVERTSSDGRYMIHMQGIQPLAGDPAFKYPLMRLLIEDKKSQVYISSEEVYVLQQKAPYNRARLHISSTAFPDKPANGMSVTCELN
jgi:hypothetical protein